MKNNKPKILYVEDDLYLSFVTKDNLEMKGYDIAFCSDGREALDVFFNGSFDLCILDVMLPEIDGFTVAKKIREKNKDIPIIFLSAKSLQEDRIEGLIAGGDDYITKPFSIEELVLKIEIFLKRSKITITDSSHSGILNIGNYQFDTDNLSLKFENKTQRLTSREADLLKFLILNRDKVLKKEDILNTVWGDDSYLNSRSLDVFVSKLRKHLKEDPKIQINSIHGIGFILTDK
ncbi:MAG: DNA-binding response regulator [Bacteroidetes bacterium 4484_249]|nr:MAG: DNA-binding response regulator [Bacteroidetes bacterium 4484_249]